MDPSFSSISRAIRIAIGSAMSLGHVHQAIAAALGYKSFAAFKASNEERPTYDGARHVVVDDALLECRLADLGHSAAYQPFLDAVRSVLQSLVPGVAVHDDVEALKDALHDAVVDAIENSGAYTSEQAMTNAYGGDFDLELNEASPIEMPQPEWIVNVTGTSSLDQEPDAVYHGDVIDVSARAVFVKLGRRVLGEMEVQGVSASIQSEPSAFEGEPEEEPWTP